MEYAETLISVFYVLIILPIVDKYIIVGFHEVESSDKREKLDSLLGDMDKDNMEKTIIFVGVSGRLSLYD